MRLDEVARQKPQAPCPLREFAVAVALIFLARCFVDSLGTGSCCFGAFLFAVVLGPIFLPLMWLVWYGQPGPRSSDLRRSR